MGMVARRRPLLRAAVVGGLGAAAYRARRRRNAGHERETAYDAMALPQPLSESMPHGETLPSPRQAAGTLGSTSERILALERLSRLRQDGVLSDEELESEKRKVLADA